ncbi:GDP-mannose 4,6-dehydratase [Rahnella sp. PD12R]|uniref:GDP-mannose 4,6-dehydratase n=1 Tax=Rahnella sp. PD12R TaxID=2855688 RepID=UPI001C4613F3|nr:GDP-mannose 4,6-dehydratase [Rahnella sp. PD12R]MBV6820336.1 GDP-mannose 4,6-dehydratase [Rahnella sp. PD12R]
MKINGKKALITGIKGFTGRYMAAELSAAGYEVHGLGTVQNDGDENYHGVDLLDVPRLKNIVDAISPDVVVHLAAIANVAHSNAEAFYAINTCGTRNLLNILSALDTKPEAVLVASSANVYGNNISGKLNERTPFNPANDYAISKVAMEYVARLYSDSLPIIITRPFNYTGRGQSGDFLIPKIVKHFREQAGVIQLGNIDVWRDFSDVRNFATHYLNLIEKKATGNVINIGSGKMYSIRETISLCEEITGHKIKIQINPNYVRKNEIKELCGDITLLQKFSPSVEMYSFKETLTWMLEE